MLKINAPTMKSVLTKDQKTTYEKLICSDSPPKKKMVVQIRYDDECGNGHNTFSITAEIYDVMKNGRLEWDSGGCLHDEIREHFPEFAHLIKWHLCSSDGPLHYIENARYWAGCYPKWCRGQENDPPNVGHLKSTIVYGAIPSDSNFKLGEMLGTSNESDLLTFLRNRLPELIEAFKRDVEKIGFTF